MKTLPRISNAEFEIMCIIWKYAPISTNEIASRLTGKRDWNYKTIQTMLSRLEKKGVIRHSKESRAFIYSPIISKSEYRKAEEETFLDRFFDGTFQQMVASYVERDDLTENDLEELQAILDQRRKK